MEGSEDDEGRDDQDLGQGTAEIVHHDFAVDDRGDFPDVPAVDFSPKKEMPDRIHGADRDKRDGPQGGVLQDHDPSSPYRVSPDDMPGARFLSISGFRFSPERKLLGKGFPLKDVPWDNTAWPDLRPSDPDSFWRLPRLSLACVRLAPKTDALPPAAVPNRFELCASVRRTADWADLSLVGNVFIRDRDTTVCAVIDFKSLRGAHRLVWKWYDPAGRLARTSDPVLVGEEGYEYDRFLAWDEFPVSSATACGRWTVALFIDERFAGSKEYEMKLKPGISPGSGCAGSG